MIEQNTTQLGRPIATCGDETGLMPLCEAVPALSETLFEGPEFNRWHDTLRHPGPHVRTYTGGVQLTPRSLSAAQAGLRRHVHPTHAPPSCAIPQRVGFKQATALRHHAVPCYSVLVATDQFRIQTNVEILGDSQQSIILRTILTRPFCQDSTIGSPSLSEN
jgi:hypothetical protein